MKAQKLYLHTDLNIRCIMLTVWSSGKCLMKTKQNTTFYAKIGDLKAIY